MRFLVLCLLFSLGSSGIVHAQAADPRREHMAVFAKLIGAWEVTGVERASSGQSFEQRGRQVYSWVLDGAAIRIETELEVVRADPDYAHLPKRRVFVSYLTYNPSSGLHEYMHLFSAARPVAATTEPLGFSFHFLLHLARKNATMEAHNRWWLESDDVLRNETRLASTDGKFTEHYQAELRRIK